MPHPLLSAFGLRAGVTSCRLLSPGMDWYCGEVSPRKWLGFSRALTLYGLRMDGVGTEGLELGFKAASGQERYKIAMAGACAVARAVFQPCLQFRLNSGTFEKMSMAWPVPGKLS